MNWTGKSSVFLVAVLALVLTGLCGAARAEVLQPQAGEQSAFFYPSFPLEGGPYITAASFWNGSGSADSLIVVFSEPIDEDSLAVEDFVFHGFEASTLERVDGATGKYAVLSGFTGTVTASVDSIGLVWDSVVGLDASRSKDIGMVPIMTGPAIVDVIFEQHFNATEIEDPYADDSMYVAVIFDHDVTLTAPPGNVFRVTPELAPILLTNTVSDNVVTIRKYTGGANPDSLRWLHPGIAKLWLEASDVYWTDLGSSALNSKAQKAVVQNFGPALMASYYNDMNTAAIDDDQVWLVYDQPLPGGSLGSPAGQYVPGWDTSGFDAAAEQGGHPSGAFYSNVVVIANPLTNEGPATPVNPDDQWIVEDSGIGDVQYDYQEVDGARRMARCFPGVGITRAAYFDRGDDAPANDQLHIWFSELLDIPDVTIEDFVLVPYIEGWQSQVIVSRENINGVGHVIISGWNNVTALSGARLPNGCFVRIAEDDSFDGLGSLSGCDGQSLIPIFDDSEPARVRLDEVSGLTYKRYNETTEADSVFLAWRETGTVDDSDQYFLFFTNQEPAASPLDDVFIQNYRQNALSVGNLTPITIDNQVQRIGLDITRSGLSGVTTTDGYPVEHGDQLRFMLVPATYWGVMADGDGNAVLKFGTTIIAGPVCPPQDWDENDDDIIHVEATYAPEGDPLEDSWTRVIYGDANAAPCGSWVYIFDRCWEGEPGDAVELGRGPINANKSFDEITLDDSVVDPDTLSVLYVYAWDDGAWSTCLPILNDIVAPSFLLVDGQIQHADRFNPYQIYKADDYVNILLKAVDHYAEGDTALSDLLAITADFTNLDDRTTLPVGLGGHPLSAVPLVSLGYDGIDNDGDWVAHDPTIDRNDDGVMDFPEPYVDENGNGVYDLGETFIDLDGDDQCDCIGGSGDDYDMNLDSSDPDEHGFYEIQLLAAGDADRWNDVIKGFQVIDPVTDPNGQTSFGEILDIPVPFSVTDTYLDTEFEYQEENAPFLCEMDEVPPTVSKVTELYQRDAFTGLAGSDNLVIPTDPVYNLGRYFDFLSETPSDEDVLFSVVEVQESGTRAWMQLTLDPPGWNVDPGVPGVAGFDDDGDRPLVPTDADEDGDVDEFDWIDLSDPEVVDAMQDSTADANAVAGDGIYRTTDRRDNDNDAFFIFEPYYDVDGGLGSSLVTQKVVWFNIDESTTNDIDDDGNGVPDNAAEVESYDPQSDDNEDGIYDGEAVELLADGARHFCVFDSTFNGHFYVDAAHILGQHGGDADGDIRALTEFVPYGFGVIDANHQILTDGALPGLPWGDDAVATEFGWNAEHGENVDWWHLAQILYGEIPDGSQQYDLRVVAYDQPGNFDARWAVPFSFTSDVTPPEVWLTDCPEGGLSADFGDGIICAEGSYTLTVENLDDVTKVYFQRRISTAISDTDTTWGVWQLISSDESLPFTAEWDASEITIPNDPPDAFVLVEFRAFGEDEFGNIQDAEEACVAQVRVEDCQAPWTWFTLIHQTANPNNDVPDVMNPPDTGSLPNPYYYRDTIGPLQVPRGPAIDIWALFSPGEGLASTTEHDVIRVVFEMSLAGTGVWTPFATVTGHIDLDDMSIDLTLPVAVTLETEALETGTYDIRVYACDIEGNNCEPADEAPVVQYDIAKITIVEEGLRAYIEPLRIDCEDPEYDPAHLQLYAINWIHDYYIDHVLFQYSEDGVAWIDIATDDGSSADPRGDIVLRRGMALLDTLSGRIAFRTDEMFIDYDGDGYSERDPIVFDYNTDGFFSTADDDYVVLGDLDEILDLGVFELTAFQVDEFHTGADTFDPTEWIFRENQSTIDPAQVTGTLNLWHVEWDITGLDLGTYWVRAVATDDMYAIDSGDIPTTTVTIDALAPAAVIATVTTPDGVEQAAVNDLYFDATVEWVKICATSADTDLSEVVLQFRIPGHALFGDWHDLDINDDEDFYADIDGIPGLSAEDEIFLDTGTVPFVWDAGDLPIYLGANGVLDAANMATPPALIPNMAFYTAAGDTIFEEDGIGDPDDDNDGMSNEDLFNGADWYPPYCIYFLHEPLGLISDTNIEFRAVATDQSCNTDPDPLVVRFMFGETVAPETDVVWARLADGTEIDVLPLLSDGTDVTQLGAADIADPIDLLVTGEDATAITQVDLLYRLVGECYGLMEWENPWRSMSADGYTELRENYDYPFAVDLELLAEEQGYGVYEFFPQAMDNEGNLTPPPENPYRFKIMLNAAVISTAGGTVAPGDEYWFTAELAFPHEGAFVSFYYAERILDVEIDATRITPDPEHTTFQTLPLDMPMFNPVTNAALTINGVPGTFYATAAELVAAGGAGSWTYDAGTKAIEFAVLPDPTDVILVSYNLTDYMYLWEDAPGVASTDGVAPYTAAWDAAFGHNVPFPIYAETEAYDVIAVVGIGEGECGLGEGWMTEGLLLLLEDELAPNAQLYGGGLIYAPQPDDDYWPGNPSYDSVAGLIEWKLSGIEHEFFATSDSLDVATMQAIFSPQAGADLNVPMALYDVGADFVPMTFTLYESDFFDVPYDFENVVLHINGFDYELAETVPGSGIWQVAGVPVPVGATTEYFYSIDQVGNDWFDTYDRRNYGQFVPPGPGGTPASSNVKVPTPPFWYAAAPSFGAVTSVWQTKAEATDFDGNIGTGHLYTFVYDPVPPTIEEVTAEMLRFGADNEVTVNAIISDPVPATFDVITVESLHVQYCPNYAAPEADRVWLEFGSDYDPSDGWAVTADIEDAGDEDGFDNDGDGEWDEADESTSAMAWRFFAMDDGGNVSAPLVLPFTLDETPPVLVMTSPAMGDVYPFGSAFDVSADVTDDEDDTVYVQFWFAADVNEHGDPIWLAVDITPEDNSDHTFDTTAPYLVEFLTTHYLDELDTYVRFRAEARDGAGNSGWSEEVLIVVNDITGPTAFPWMAQTTGGDFLPLTDPHLAVTGHGAVISGTAVDPSGRGNLAWVRVQYQAPGSGSWLDIAIVPSDDFVLAGYNEFTVGWSVSWDVVALPEGVYQIRAIASDFDDNYDEDPITAPLRIDHTAPEVLYELAGSDYHGFPSYYQGHQEPVLYWAYYENDGIVDHSSQALRPDVETGDMAFTIVTRSADIAGIDLQMHQDGTHGLGEWITYVGDSFDFEPNLTFQQGGETYYVWWMRIDDARDVLAGIGLAGVVEVRALAYDYAGNANILHDAKNDWQAWTIDVDDPTKIDFHHDLVADQVASGDPVTFTAVLTDSTTDVVSARFEYSVHGEDAWLVIDPNPATPEIEAIPLTGENIDTPFARWTASVTWTTPYPLVQDMAYDVRVVFYDTPGWWEDETLTITVEDNIKPEFTKIWAIPAAVKWVDDTYYGSEGDGYEVDCEGEVEHDGLYIDLDGDGVYSAGDIGLDTGTVFGGFTALEDGDEDIENVIGSATNTWPRYIDEIVLGGTLEKMVSHEVVLVARTQIDDTGLERVEFWAESAAGGEPILIGTDECAPAYAMGFYLWHVRWNTLDIDQYGDPIYPDGVYTIVPVAYDLEGNVEEWGDRDLSGAAVVTVDNTAPEATTTVVPATVERNDILSLWAETDAAGLQDDEIYFKFKRATDLNMGDAWMAVPGDEGVDDSDINPDWTRPYVFDWDLDKMDVPFPLEDPIVGLSYHVAAQASDILGNLESVGQAFEAGRYATFTVVDTRAPVATITKIERITGDTTPITNPHLMGTIHARDLAYLKAKILGFENDTEIVEFMWAEVGDTTPMLIDAQVTKDPDDPYTWRIYSWDLSPLAGRTLEVFAVATDDVGNSDFNATTGRPIAGPVFTLFVDYAVPVLTVTTPVDDMKECRVDPENRYYDLMFNSSDADIDIDRIAWEYKLSRYEDDPLNWSPCVLTAPGVVWDVESETFAASWDVVGESEVALIESELYDVSLTVYDVAGNVYRSIVAERVVIDVDAPWGQITRVDVEGESFYPTLPIDITTGMTIDLWATAHDVEEGLPLGTGVAEIIFQTYGPLENDGPLMTWRDIGFWHAPDDELPHEEVSTSVSWNTSGIMEGTYSVRIMVMDEECNDYTSGMVTLVISDMEPPRARIAGFDPWQIPHGDDPTTFCDVYAVAYSDSVIAEVQFQYTTDGTNWIPFGITRDIEDDVPDEHSDWADDMCDLWYATIDLRTFEVGDQVWFRAIAKDEVPNQDPTPPTVLVEVVEYLDGSLDLAAVDTLPDLTNLDAVLEGGSDPDDFVVQVQMGRADQRPYVLYLPPTPVGEGGQPWCVEMVRMIDTPFSSNWQGAVEWIWDDCGKSTLFAGALSDELEIDLHVKHIWSWDIDYVLGSNGTAHVPGYMAADDTPERVDYLYATATVPTSSGEGDYEGCLLLFPSVTPALSPDEVRYLQMLPRTGYAMGLIEDEIHEVQPGYPWTLSIQYDEAGLQAAAVAAGVDPTTVEEYLTVRAYNWNDDADFGRVGWTGDDISFIDVDTVTNTVTFKVDSWCYSRPHFALFVPKWDAPVVVRSFTPWSPYADRWNYTDCDPKILIDLNASGLDQIDPYTIEVYIDGNHVASWMESGEWAEGNGDIDVQQKNFEGTRYQVYYQHSTNRAWWLTEGEHTLDVMFKYVTGTEDWVSLPATAEGATFFVDNTAPYIAFHGGWINNPLLRNVSGYLNPYKMEDMLTVYMYDGGAGILVRPEHLYPLFGSEGDDSSDVVTHEDIIEDDACIGDPGIKYDLWLVHDEDDQVEVDEIEERLLLHQGTADEIIPYITPLLFADEGAYTPADTMVMRLPIVAGGRTHDIRDGDILEVTLYSKKHIEHMEDFTAGCDIGLIVNFDPDQALSDTLAMFYIDCYYDRATGLHVYDRGIYDWAGNSGSKYVEQRFVVDMSAPTAVLIDPVVGWVEPGKDFDFVIQLEDGGSGVALATAKLFGPDGMEIVDGVTITKVGDKLYGRVIGGLPAGVYNVVIDVTDKAGNTTTLSVPIVVEAATLAMNGTYVTPNPSNPNEGQTTINFTLTRSADVTIKVYDFAGEYVGTLVSNHHFGAQNNAWPWAGVAPDGTPLANGAYMIRIEAYDGTARKTAVVKAVVWRE